MPQLRFRDLRLEVMLLYHRWYICFENDYKLLLRMKTCPKPTSSITFWICVLDIELTTIETIATFQSRRIGWEKYINQADIKSFMITNVPQSVDQAAQADQAAGLISSSSVKSRIGRDRDVIWSFSSQSTLILGRWGKPGEVEVDVQYARIVSDHTDELLMDARWCQDTIFLSFVQ